MFEANSQVSNEDKIHNITTNIVIPKTLINKYTHVLLSNTAYNFSRHQAHLLHKSVVYVV